MGHLERSPADVAHTEKLYKLALEKLIKLGLVLTLCDGNVLRSRVGAQVLKSYRIPSISAAVGDISKQINKIISPDLVMRCVNRKLPTRSDYGWQSGNIKQVEPLMAACARYILVYCPLSHLPNFIDPSDPRVHSLFCPDPKDESEYSQTIDQVQLLTVEFVRKLYPDRLAEMTAPAVTSLMIGQRIDEELKELDFSCVPHHWGSPLQQFSAFGEIF